MFVWAQSHLGLVGKSTTERAANEACGGCISDECMPLSDFKSLIFKYLQAKWQAQWDALPSCKLRDAFGIKSCLPVSCFTA